MHTTPHINQWSTEGRASLSAGMASTLENILMIVYAVIFLVGILGNGFILLVNCIDWIKNRRFSLMDCILTCLAISRIFMLCIIILSIGLHVISVTIWCNNDLLISLENLWIGSNYFCTVCTTCLSVFYFLKIANFSNLLFLWMKWRIHKVLLIIVLGAALSFGLSLLFKDTVVKILLKNQIDAENNVTLYFSERKHILTSHLFLGTMFIIPFVVSLTSFVLLILSLWSHLRHMKSTVSRDTSTEAHVRAMKSMISFLLLFILYYASNILLMWGYGRQDNFVVKIFSNVLLFFYPSGHPFLMILWNSKLKQASLRILRKLNCSMNPRKPTLP